jgi:hypothetical protein
MIIREKIDQGCMITSPDARSSIRAKNRRSERQRFGKAIDCIRQQVVEVANSR